MREFDENLLCDRCHTIVEKVGDVYAPDLCDRCREKFDAWVDECLDLMEHRDQG